jgi:hypothetical protein
VDSFVVADALAKAVPEHLEPPVPQGPEGGVVGLAAGSLGVVELPGPTRARERAEGPLLDGVRQFSTPTSLQCYGGKAPVTRRSGKNELVVSTRLACNRHLFDVIADLTGDLTARRTPRPPKLR